MTGVLRRLVPYTLLPLAIVACLLASSPWLRAFPSSVMAIPLIGTAVLSVLLPVLVVAIGIRRLWLTALIDVIGFVFFTTLATLHEPAGFADLWTGLVHGPSQILTYALPLVSPRTLLVAPIALCWITGAIIGECLGRGWRSALPYATLLVAFGLSYAATTRAITNADDGRRYDTLLAGALLLTLLLLRAAQAWVEQDSGADAAEPDGALPVRGLVFGVAVSVVVALVAAAVAQASVFSGSPSAPERVPPLARTNPLAPLAFVSGLRPENPRSAGTELFEVSLDRRTSRYVGLADVDTYDGDGWSFSRKFRPSGGVVPVDADPSARSRGKPVTQQYKIAEGALTSAPWMPFQYRPERVNGVSVNVDATSGMIVPSRALHAGQSYTVRSTTPSTSFDRLPDGALAGTSPPPADTFLPPSVRRSLTTVVTALQNETGTPDGTPPIQFLQAVLADFRDNYALSGGPSSAPAPGSTTPGSPSSSPSTTAIDRTAGPRAGSSSFADVLASILGPTRSASPEQYATLVALLGRQLGVPTRVVSGFRLGTGQAATVDAGTYRVTTREAWTWVEVPVRGRGWVVLDASPTTYSSQRPQPSLSVRPSPTSTPSSTPNALLTQASSNAGNAVAPKSATPGAGTTGVTLAALIVAGAVVLLLLIVLGLVLRKRLRARGRRRARDPRQRLVGAWQEGLDLLVESGLREVSALTSAEVVAVAADRFGGEPAEHVQHLGESANSAIFNPSVPVGADDADAAWRAHAGLRRSVRRRLTVRERVSAGLRYHRPRASHPVDRVSSWVDHEWAQSRPSGRHRAH